MRSTPMALCRNEIVKFSFVLVFVYTTGHLTKVSVCSFIVLCILLVVCEASRRKSYSTTTKCKAFLLVNGKKAIEIAR